MRPPRRVRPIEDRWDALVALLLLSALGAAFWLHRETRTCRLDRGDGAYYCLAERFSWLRGQRFVEHRE